MAALERTRRQKSQVLLDELPSGSVVLDCFGHAWQLARSHGALGSTYNSGYWYRAYGDSSEVSSHVLSFKCPFEVMEVVKVKKLSRDAAVKAIRAYAAEGQEAMAARIFVENRVSRASYLQALAEGRAKRGSGE